MINNYIIYLHNIMKGICINKMYLSKRNAIFTFLQNGGYNVYNRVIIIIVYQTLAKVGLDS